LSSCSLPFALKVVTLAGKATEAGHFDGAMHQARFHGSTDHMGLAVRESDGAIFVADSYNHCIRMILNSQVSTVAGVCGSAGNADGAALIAARFDFPTGLAIDPSGSLFICDTNNSCVKVLKDGEVSTIPPSLQIPTPISITVSKKTGDIYVTSNDQTGKPYLYLLHPRKGGETYSFSALLQRSRLSSVGLGWVDDLFVLDAKGNIKTKFYSESEKYTLLSGTKGARVMAVSPTEECVVFVGNCATNPGNVYRYEKGAIVPLFPENVSKKADKSLDGRVGRARFIQVCGLSIGPNGDIYVADAGKAIRVIQVGLQNDANAMIRQRKTAFDFSAALEGSDAMPTDLELNLGPTSFSLHKWFIDARCPYLLNADLKALPLKPEAARAFVKFLYTNVIPEASTLAVDFDFAVRNLSFALPTRCLTTHVPQFLLHSTGFTEEAGRVVYHYHSITITFDDTIQLYEHCCALEWRQGEQFCIKKLRDFGSKLPPIKLSSSDGTIRLYHRIIAENLESAQRYNTARSIQRALSLLFSNRDGADFQICIGESHEQKCHSVFLSTRWPFFDQMLQAQMRESVSKTLVLSPDEFEPWMLYPLLMAIYGQDTSTTVAAWDLEKALRFLVLTRMYVADEDLDGDCAPAFQELVGHVTSKIVNCISEDTCIEIYRLSREHELDDIVSLAEAKILESADTIMRNPEMLSELEALPDAEELLEKYKQEMAKKAPQLPTRTYPAPTPFQLAAATRAKAAAPAPTYNLPDEVYYRGRERCDVM
jgi:hypothetical protein